MHRTYRAKAPKKLPARCREYILQQQAKAEQDKAEDNKDSPSSDSDDCDYKADDLGVGIPCFTRNGVVVVGLSVLCKMGRFMDSYNRRNGDEPFRLRFNVHDVSKKVFIYIVKWCLHRVRYFGETEPKIVQDIVTNVRKPLSVDDYEQKFFDKFEVPSDLRTIIIYSRKLQVNSLHLLSCQEMAKRLRFKLLSEMRYMLNILDDSTKLFENNMLFCI